METKKSDIIDNRHVINPHVDSVTGKTQIELNEELSSKFITLNPEHPLFQKLSKDVEFLNKGILVINNDSEDPSIYIKDTEGNIVKISGNGSMTVNNAEEAINEASTNNIGQLIYIQNNSSYGGEDYSFGPYIVIGDKTIIKLSTSTPSGDVSGDVVILKNDVKELKDGFNELNEVIGSEEDFTGIFGKIKEVQDNLDNINIPDVPVQDIKVNGTSVLGEGGVAAIVLPDFNTFEKLADANAVRGRMDAAEDAIEGLDAAVKAIDIPVQDVKVNGASILGEDGVAAITLPDFNTFEKLTDANAVRERMGAAEGAITALQGKDTELADAIEGKVAKEDGKSLVADDEIAKLTTVAEGAQVNSIEIIKVNGEELQIDKDKSVNISIVQELNGGSGINITEDNVINVKLSKDEKYLTIDENGALITHDINSTTIVNNSDELLEIAERISTKEGTLVYLNETDERYLKGLYYINETNTPYRILSDDGSEDTITTIFNKFDLIDNYSVNNKVISTEGGITINADDISVNDITIANQGYGKMGVVNTIPENKPTVEKSIEILQNNIAALTIAMSASLNEFNTLIQEMRNDIEKLKGTE